MNLKNSEQHFGVVAVVFHWLLAVFIIGLLAVGLYMISLPLGSLKLKLYGWHKGFGILVLTLVCLRILWRFYNINPLLSLPSLEKFAARFVHWLLYLLMLAMPLSGWAMSSAAGFDPSFFGLFTLPSLVSPNEELRELFALIHEYLAYSLIAVILLHSFAALKHHFYDRDDILTRMLKWG
jgi:cytochrome b561